MNTETPMQLPIVLTGYDCWRLLEDEEIARVAWSSPDGVAIVPVNYAVADGQLWFRTRPDTALARQCAGGRVVVEADHLDEHTRAAWSVVVVGTADRVPSQEVPDNLIGMDVWAPGPHSLFIRVTPGEVTGRRLWGRPATAGDATSLPARADGAIAGDVLRRLSEVGHDGWLVEVRGGVVTIGGPADAGQASLAHALASTTAGVLDVHIRIG